MARIRSIKPDFWTDEKITECSLSARLLFIGTWNFADDRGNLPRSTKKLKMQIFPGDDIDCEPLVQELIDHGLLIEYSVNGEKFLHIKGFLKHQKINRPSKNGLVPEYSESAHETLTESSLTEKEKEKEKEKKISSGKPDVPAGFAQFWAEWPNTDRKVAKAKCLERWRKAGLEACAEAIIADVRRNKATNRQWLGGYEPAPLTYLNQRRWEDGQSQQAGAWWQEAGFSSPYEAENAGCTEFTFELFRDGKRVEVSA
jgi:hypothetical protein